MPEKKRGSQPKTYHPRYYRKPSTKRKLPKTLPVPAELMRQVDEVFGE